MSSCFTELQPARQHEGAAVTFTCTALYSVSAENHMSSPSACIFTVVYVQMGLHFGQVVVVIKELHRAGGRSPLDPVS